MKLSDIKSGEKDEQLLKLLLTELKSRLPVKVLKDLDAFVQKIRALPLGLRAMASTHRLDISMALDDLGWHFYNFHHRTLCDEIEWGLKELEANEPRKIFKQARTLVEPYWEQVEHLKSTPSGFAKWYKESGLEKALKPLNEKIWDICSALGANGLMTYWLSYARRYPEKLLHA